MTFDWLGLLRQINDAELASDALRAELPRDALASAWLSFDAATNADVAALELESNAPSYREFLTFTNGWRTLNYAIDRPCSSNSALASTY